MSDHLADVMHGVFTPEEFAQFRKDVEFGRKSFITIMAPRQEEDMAKGKKDQEVRSRYLKAEPKFLGDLHQRMQRVMTLLREQGALIAPVQGDPAPIDLRVWHELWHAVHDLELEVSYYEPAQPPYGRRPVSLDEFQR